MKIYLDYIFLENLIIDSILLKETAKLSKINVSNTRIIITSLLSSCYVVVMIYFNLNFLEAVVPKLLLLIVMVYICFKPTKIKAYIKLIALYITVCSVNVGINIMIEKLFNISNSNVYTHILMYILGFGIGKYIITELWQIYKSKIKTEALIYDVVITLDEKKYKYKGFLDTGNNVYSYVENLPILFANIEDSSILERLSKLEKFNIQTVTLANASQKTAYIIDNIQISNKNNSWRVKAGVVFESRLKNKDYNMILNYKLFEENLGGIEI